VDRLQEIARRHNRSTGEVAIAWTLHHPAVTGAIVGARNERQAEGAMQAGELQQADQIFNAFFTTKAHGTGMGLRISRTIVESHGGRLWASDNSPRGASFCFALPIKADAQLSDARS
jgi:K+-sensing histidine kinase KdpD